MKTVPVHEARNNFSSVFDEALNGKPVRVSRHGREAVVVVSEKEWRRLTRRAPPLGELLTNCPIQPDDIPERTPAGAFGMPAD